MLPYDSHEAKLFAGDIVKKAGQEIARSRILWARIQCRGLIHALR